MAYRPFRGITVAAAMIAISLGSKVQTNAQDPINLLGLPSKSIANRGAVILCGGGELPDAVHDEFVRLAGGRRARVVLIPSAHPHDGFEQLEARFAGWKDYDLTSFEFLDTDDPAEANRNEFIAPLERATGVWIAGGSQTRLIERYGGRKVEMALQRVVERGGVVAGYSAGAAVLSRVIIRGGTSTDAVLDKGFGLLDRVVVDTHFSQRSRHTRLLNVLDEHPRLIGIGVDETSAIIIRQNHLNIMGDARVTIMISRGDGLPVVVHQLRDGDEGDLALISSPFASGNPTVEFLSKDKGR